MSVKLDTEKLDIKFMSYAIALSRKNLGLCGENPSVGCVITIEDEIITTGVTEKGGRPHGEIVAINKVIDKKILKNATIYVTLEPCSHFGKSGPCVDEIIKHQFKRVVIAAKDPNPLVDGAGIAKLKNSQIEVVTGILEKEAREINRGFFCAQTTGKPFITLKLATSLDGKIATKNYDSKWITGEKARQYSHYLRSINDAILVGANTARFDNPSLDCRIVGLEEYSPLKIILSRNLDFDKNLNIFKNPEKTIILTTSTKKIDFAKVIICGEKDGKIDLEDALKKLAQIGVNSVLIEGGAMVASEFLKANLVDELVWMQNKKILGNDAVAAIGDLEIARIDQALSHFTTKQIQNFDDDLVINYRR